MGICSSKPEPEPEPEPEPNIYSTKGAPYVIQGPSAGSKVSTWKPHDSRKTPRPSSSKASDALQAMVKNHSVSENVSIHDVYSGMPKVGEKRKHHALGEGACGKVYKVKHKTTGKYFACKSIKIKSGDEHERKQLMEEIKLIKMLDHPNTIKVIEVFQTRRELQIVMEMCTGGELFDRLYEQPQNHFSEDNCKRLFKQMLKSLSYIHANQIFHRDIKLENFLFTDKSVQSDIKLIDFGFSKEFDHLGKVFHQFVGTCYYMAPEVFKRNYGMEADMWSIAVVFFMMLTGEVPFNGGTQDEIMATIQSFGQNQEKCRKHVLKKLESCGISEGACSFLLGLFKINPKQRLTASAALRNVWLNSPHNIKAGPLHMSSATSSADSVKSLLEFKHKTALQRSAMLAMSMSMTPSELKALGSSFRTMDTNNDGVITLEEFKAHLEKTGTSNEDIDDLFKKIDMDGSGSIQYSEFIAASIVVSEDAIAGEVEAAFAKLDLDGSKSLTADELRNMLPKLDKAKLNEIIAEADTDNDGNIDLQEFKIAFSKGSELAVDLEAASLKKSTPQTMPIPVAAVASTTRGRISGQITRMTSIV